MEKKLKRIPSKRSSKNIFADVKAKRESRRMRERALGLRPRIAMTQSRMRERVSLSAGRKCGL